MKRTDNFQKNSQQTGKNQESVAMIVYLNQNGNESETRAYWANFEMDSINHFIKETEEASESIPELSNYLWDIITNEPLSLNPDSVFYGVLMNYILGNNTVKEKIQRCPNGGWGIIAGFNLDDQSDQEFQFLNPKEMKKRINSDFTETQFNWNDTGIAFNGDSIICDDFEEAVFLSCFTELIRISESSSCHFSNEELAKRVPEPLRNLEWIARTLGKFSRLEIIEIFTYEVDGSIWHRDINLIYPANHIFFGMEQKQSA